MKADGYLFETLAITVPITCVLWWAWVRGKVERTRRNRWWLSFATAFLIAPTFMRPYGQWNVYPAWWIFIQVLFVGPLAVFIFGVLPVTLVALLIYAVLSRSGRKPGANT